MTALLKGVARAVLATAFLVAALVAVTPAAAAGLEAKTNRDGMVTVKVTPQAVAAGGELRFEVVLDTHSVDLSQDLRDSAVLVAGGEELKPTGWQGDPPGGHHRKGVLVFAPVSPMPATLTLKIRGVGAPERVFTWSLAP
ncbi:MAG: hypothetical protein ACM30I_00155 [Gemmatimonas sp.]